MTQRRCQACRGFYDKKLGPCPDCGAKPYEFNVSLRKGQLNSHLYAQAERAA